MGIFGSIKNAIFGGDDDKVKAPQPASVKPAGRPPVPSAPRNDAKPAQTGAVASRPDPISEDEMRRRIAAMPNADKFNWETSLVDLMKMVGVDPSYENRKELAQELGVTDYEGTAEQNINLHHAVLNMLAAEGGNTPGMLKD